MSTGFSEIREAEVNTALGRVTLRPGDQIRVIGVPPSVETYHADVIEEARVLFANLVGNVYTVDGFNELDFVEIHTLHDGTQATDSDPIESDLFTIWIEPEYVEVVRSVPTNPSPYRT